MRTARPNEALTHHYQVKTLPLPTLVLAATSILGPSGCNTTPQASRIAELPAVYDQLSRPAQKEVARGSIDAGYTLEMVHLALGKPGHIETTADGQETQWTYYNFYPSAQVNDRPLYTIPQPDLLKKEYRRWSNETTKVDGAESTRGGMDSPSGPRNPAGSASAQTGTGAVKLDVFFNGRGVARICIDDQEADFGDLKKKNYAHAL